MIDFDLTEEQRLLEQSVREWARARSGAAGSASSIASTGSTATSCRRWRSSGCSALGAGRVRRRRDGLHQPRHHQRGARVRRHVAARDHVGARRAQLPVAAHVGHRGSEAAVPRAAGAGEEDRDLRPDRAGRRQRRARHPDRRRSRRAIATSSPARRCGSRSPTSPTTSSSSPGPTSRRRSSAIRPGISAFIVERAFKGFSSGTLKEKWGILAGNTGFFKMDEVEVPEENLLGKPGEGFKIAMFALDQGRYTVAAGATGLIRACRDASAKYAKERKTFGVEIAEHQLVKEMIAQMESRLSGVAAAVAARRVPEEPAAAATRARPASPSGSRPWPPSAPPATAVQMHGANGYSDEYPVGRFYRNCKGAVIYEGTREIHKIMQADYVLGFRQDQADALRAAAVHGVGKRELTDDELRSLARVPARRRAGGDRLRPHDGPGRRPQVRPGGGRGDARVAGHRADRRHDRHRRRGARRGADALHRREGRARARTGKSACGAPAAGRHRRRSAGGHEPLRDRRAERDRGARGVRAAAGCCTRPISTWRSSSSARARSTSVSLDAPRRREPARRSPKSLDRDVEDLVVIVLDRPRHEQLIAGHPRHRRAHPADRRRRPVGRHRGGGRRQRRPRGDGHRRRAGRRADGRGDALPERRDLRAAWSINKPRARGALPRDGHHRSRSASTRRRTSPPATTSSSPPPASPTAR